VTTWPPCIRISLGMVVHQPLLGSLGRERLRVGEHHPGELGALFEQAVLNLN
jgi:hypothetical protein